MYRSIKILSYATAMLVAMLTATVACIAAPAPLDLRVDAQGRAQVRTAAGQTLTQADCAVAIWDGKARAEVIHKLHNDPSLAQGEATFETRGNNLSLQHKLTQNDGQPVWEVAITNHRQEQAWLEVRLTGHFTGDEPWMFYNAASADQPANSSYHAETTFWPGIAMADDKAGLWVSVDPNQIFSLITYRFDGMEAGDRGAFHIGARIVIDPEKTETIRFVLVGFTPNYGHRSALDAYYQAFPHLFNPSQGIDPRVLRGGCGLGMTWRQAGNNPEWSGSELMRRAHATWDWMYAPFRVPGDPVMRKDKWDMLPPDRRSDSSKTWQQIEAFREARKDYFYVTDVLQDVAPLFYTIHWVHDLYAETIFNDSLMTEDLGWENGTNSRKGWIAKTGYVKAGPWHSIQTFAWGTNAAESFKQDYKDLVASDLPMSGFAFDSNVSGGKYRGPRVNELPGRAWDADGVFVSEGLAQAKMANYVQRLDNNGYRTAAVSNHPGTHYAVGFAVDTAIQEIPWGKIISPNGNIIGREYARVQSGHKPRNLYKGFTHITTVLPNFAGWQEMSAEQIRQTMQQIQDRMLIFALAYGWHMHPDMVIGDARMMRYAQPVSELVYRGWQPVPAMKADDTGTEFYLSRYGDKQEAFFALGNNRDQRLRTSVRVDPEPFDGWRPLLAGYWGRAIPMQYDQTDGRFLVDLAQRDVLVLRAPIMLQSDEPFEATTQFEGDAHAGRLTASIKTTTTGNFPARITLPEHMQISAITLNRKAVTWQATDHERVFAVTLPLDAGVNELEVAYTSQWVLNDVKSIQQFDFIDSNITLGLCKIVLPNEPTDLERGAAYRLQEYFRWWSYTYRSEQIVLPIVPESQANDGLLVMIGNTKRQQQPGIVLKDGALFVRGESPRQTADMLNHLLYLLDGKYPAVGTFENQINYAERPLVVNYYDSKRWADRYPWIPKDAAGEIERIFRKGQIWGRPLRDDTYPAGVAIPSQILGSLNDPLPEPVTTVASADASRQAATNSRQYLFDGREEDLLFDHQKFVLVNDGGQISAGGTTEPSVYITSRPDSGYASLLMPLSNAGVLTQANHVVVRVRLQNGQPVPGVQFLISARANNKWLPRVAPDHAPEVMKIGQWYELSYPVSDWPTDSLANLRLYFANRRTPQPMTFEISRIWVD